LQGKPNKNTMATRRKSSTKPLETAVMTDDEKSFNLEETSLLEQQPVVEETTLVVEQQPQVETFEPPVFNIPVTPVARAIRRNTPRFTQVK